MWTRGYIESLHICSSFMAGAWLMPAPMEGNDAHMPQVGHPTWLCSRGSFLRLL
jgi:hypothetical protein